MARIVYALNGQGRGHRSRATAMVATLRQRGHDVRFCCGGASQAWLAAQDEFVLPVPALAQVVEANRVRPGATVRRNWRTVLRAPSVIDRLADRLRAYAPDLLIADFEPFACRAAQRLGMPVVTLDHQQIVTETAYPLPLGERLSKAVTSAVIRRIVPAEPAHALLTSFFAPPLRRPGRATLVPPILRPAVRRQTPTDGAHVLVYFNETRGAGRVLDTLRQIDAPFALYNFDAPADPAAYPNLRFEPPSTDGFLQDLASARAVVSTAGFTLISEALHLGKPVLAVPNRGLFEHEQWLNASFLEREGLGEAILDGPLAARDVRAFLRRSSSFAARLADYRAGPHGANGNRAAALQLERHLARPAFVSAA